MKHESIMQSDRNHTQNATYHTIPCIWNIQNRQTLTTESWRRQWHPTPVLLPGKSHGWRSLVGHSPWGHEESDSTEQLHFYFSLSCIGEGNGNPLQCSCLENPRDGGAWWVAIYGVGHDWSDLAAAATVESRLVVSRAWGVGEAGHHCKQMWRFFLE